MENLKLKKMSEMVRKMTVKQINVENLEDQIMKLKPSRSRYYENILELANTFVSFCKICLTFCSSGLETEIGGKSVDLIEKISAIPIEKNTYIKFVPFLTESSQLKLESLHFTALKIF